MKQALHLCYGSRYMRRLYFQCVFVFERKKLDICKFDHYALRNNFLVCKMLVKSLMWRWIVKYIRGFKQMRIRLYWKVYKTNMIRNFDFVECPLVNFRLGPCSNLTVPLDSNVRVNCCSLYSLWKLLGGIACILTLAQPMKISRDSNLMSPLCVKKHLILFSA